MLKDLRNTAIQNRRILVIDDNLAIHEDFRKTLATTTAPDELDEAGASLFDEAPVAVRSESFELRFADQGETGFHMVEQAVAAGTPYALAFVDMRMPPGWDGLHTIEQIGTLIWIFRWLCVPPSPIIPGMKSPHGSEKQTDC